MLWGEELPRRLWRKLRSWGLVQVHHSAAMEAALLMLLAIGVGLVSGAVAVGLFSAVHWSIGAMERFYHTAWLLVIPAVGAGLAAFFLHNILKDNSGHGVPELIRSASLKGGQLRADLTWSRVLSSFLTVGSGGSAGLEGPIATTGGAIGSFAGKLLRLNERRRTLLLGYGVAGAIAGIFNAPLTGSIFALEIILREWNARTILPTLLSAVSATQLSRLLLGSQSAFSIASASFSTQDLFACVILGLATGVLSVLFQHGLVIGEHVFQRFIRQPGLRAGLGGLAVGSMGFFMPAVLHDGYIVIQSFLDNIASYSWQWVVLFILVKFTACCCTLSSGGSGGVFAPSLVLGGATGFGFGRTLQSIFPLAGFASPNVYALVGMAGMVAGLMHAPLTGMFLVLEITAGYQMIIPLMIVSAFAMLVNYFFEEGSIYTMELVHSGELTPKGSDAHLLRTMASKELLDTEDLILREHTSLGEFVELFKQAKRNVFPVVSSNKEWRGLVYLNDIRPYLFDTKLYSLVTMGAIMHNNLPVIQQNETAGSAIQKFEESGAWSLPVVNNKRRYLGMMSKSTLFDRYRRELIVHTTK